MVLYGPQTEHTPHPAALNKSAQIPRRTNASCLKSMTTRRLQTIGPTHPVSEACDVFKPLLQVCGVHQQRAFEVS